MFHRAGQLTQCVLGFLPLPFLAVNVNGIANRTSDGGFIEAGGLKAVARPGLDSGFDRHLVYVIAQEDDRRSRTFLPDLMQKLQSCAIA